MSLFDHYRPGGDLRCPACSRELREWQGKDGPNGLLVWAEGIRHPVDQLVDDDVQLELAEREESTLPERFVIYSYDCSLHHPVYADCSAPGGTWCDTAIRPLEETRGHVDGRVRDRTVR